MIGERTMLEHVWRRAQESGAEQVLIATDDSRIESAAHGFGAEVCMTSASHPSGTDRLGEVVAAYGWPDDTIVVNLQGDEPLMPPALLRQVAQGLETHADACIATLCSRLQTRADAFDPNLVKVVFDHQGYALFFSRAPIPWDRDGFARDIDAEHPGLDYPSYGHIGLYAYRVDYLRRHAQLPPCELERGEALEQLRALWHGERIWVGVAEQAPGRGVDTEHDLHQVRELLGA